MKKDDHLRAAIAYREQLQERHQKEIYLDKDILFKGCEHIRDVFPGSYDSEDLPIEVLYKFFLDRDIDEKLSLEEVEDLVNREIEDPNHPLRMLFDGNETKFDNFLSGAITKDYIKDIELACEDLGYDIRGGVSAGIISQEIIQAEQQPVFLTESSVINVTNNLHLLTHRLSKLIAKSFVFEYDDGEKYQLSSKFDEYKKRILADREIQRQWDSFFFDCSYNPSSPSMGEVVNLNSMSVQNCFSDMKDAMMLFIVGHEYGHHICQHSSDLSDKLAGLNQDREFLMEHQADIVGSQLVMSIGRRPEYFNFFAATNVGALCILKVLDFIESGHRILLNGRDYPEKHTVGTHPPTKDRIGVLRAYIKDYEYEDKSAALSLRLLDLVEELLCFIWSNSRRTLEFLHEKGERPKKDNDMQWLP